MLLFQNDAANWAAWGTWAYVGLTLVIAVAGFGVWRLTQNQLAEAVRSREASVHPVVLFDKAALLPYPGTKRFVELRVRNVGIGPALEVEIAGWVKPVPADVMADKSALFEPWRQAMADDLLALPAAGRAKIAALEVEKSDVCYLLDGMRAVIDVGGADWVVVYVAIRFQDLYENWHVYPRPQRATGQTYTWRLAQFENREPVLH